MLSLSELLMAHGDELSSFSELQALVANKARSSGEMFFEADIEPPAYDDRPQDWQEQLFSAFENA